MKYNPEKHHRRSIRLKGYDYTRSGGYFITICTHQKSCLFAAIANKQLVLNRFGHLASECWQAIPQHFPGVELDEFIVMPNHIHGILIMTNNRQAMALPNPYQGKFGKPIPGSISIIIGSFKSAVSKQINILRNSKGVLVWQRNYYEHIIRDDESLNRIRNYIINNPLAWKNDKLYSDGG
jgi:putative transposase